MWINTDNERLGRKEKKSKELQGEVKRKSIQCEQSEL